MKQTNNSGIAQRYLPNASSIPSMLFGMLVLCLLVAGWNAHLENYISPESGIGYILGIVGSSMMLMMLLYSLRKRVRMMRKWFATKYWFRMHMMFGVLGPTCILYHCAFSLGSINSNVALICMLTVAGSGLIGRYIYRQIHYGLYGNKTTATQLKEDLLESVNQIETIANFIPDIEKKLFRINIDDLLIRSTLPKQFLLMFIYAVKGRFAEYQAYRTVNKSGALLQKHENWDRSRTRQFTHHTKHLLKIYYATIRKIVGFQFYERMFSLWHVLHIPLFIMMIISGVVHVFAVHLY